MCIDGLDASNELTAVVVVVFNIQAAENVTHSCVAV
jgi:hypothetical protein